MKKSFWQNPFVRGPVRIGALRCADGRMRHFNRAIGAKPGMLFDMRAVGGVKTFLSYAFRDRLSDWLLQGGEEHVMLLTYHFDCIERELGCRGHGYDVGKAIAIQQALWQDLHDGFEGRIHPLLIGFDTRLEELVLHGKSETVRVSEMGGDGSVLPELMCLWPDIPLRIVEELAPLMAFNGMHVATNVLNGHRALEKNHQEVGLVIGRRVGWIVDEDDGLQTAMVEDTSLDQVTEIELGINLLKGNLRHRRIPKENGVFIFVCIPYWERYQEKGSSSVAARKFASLARELVHMHAPEIEASLTYLVCVICEETRQITVLEGSLDAHRLFAAHHGVSMSSTELRAIT